MTSLTNHIEAVEEFLAKPIAEGWYKLSVSERLHLLDHPEAIAKPIQRTSITRKELATEMLRIAGEPNHEQRTIIRMAMLALRTNGWTHAFKRVGYIEDNPPYLGLQRPCTAQ